MRSAILLALCLLALATAASADGAAGRPRVGLVLEAGSDEPYGGIAYDGFRRAVSEFGVLGKAVTRTPGRSSFSLFASLARQRYDLVLGLGYEEAKPLVAAARAYPRTRFALVDMPWEELSRPPRNVLGTRYRVEQAAFLAGYLAALMEQRRPGRDVVGAVGGRPAPTVDPFIAGFRAGARKADPHIRVLVDYANTFYDPAPCDRAAQAQIAKGAGVVFQVAGMCGLGALEAARRSGVWGIGVDSDQSGLGPHILTSVVKRMDVAAYELVRALVHGTLGRGRSLVYDLADQGVGLGKVSPKVPRALLVRLEHVREQIVAGKIGPIPTTVR